MAESKYGKYIVTQGEKQFEAPWEGEYKPDEIKKVVYLDSSVLKGAFYVETAWFLPAVAKKEGHDVEPHQHDFDEVLTFIGTDPEDPYDLNGEIEFWMEDEKILITSSCAVFVPKGMKHCPFIVRRVDRPIFHFTSGPQGMYR